MSQLHCEIYSFDCSFGEIHSDKLISWCKKMHILTYSLMNQLKKKIPNQCILNKCNWMGITTQELYEMMYYYQQIDNTTCFKKDIQPNHNSEIQNQYLKTPIRLSRNKSSSSLIQSQVWCILFHHWTLWKNLYHAMYFKISWISTNEIREENVKV